MSVITHPVRKSNLATMIGSAGGISVGTALARARGAPHAVAVDS